MWKKSESEAIPAPPPRKAAPPRNHDASPRKARIGAGLLLKGDLFGEEDVIIEGRIEGRINLKNHGVIVEESGEVEADISASSICVAGEVRGDLHGSEQVVLLKTGRVQGNIKAKSVTLETGAQFNGTIDMETVAALESAPSRETRAASDAPKPNGSVVTSVS